MSRPLHELFAQAEAACAGIPELLSGVRKLPNLIAVDPEAGLMRVRKLLDFIVQDIFVRQYDEPAGTRPLENLMQRLVKDGHLPKKLFAQANLIREFGNLGAHDHAEAFAADDVECALENLVPILVWYRAQVAPPETSESRVAPPARGNIEEAIDRAIRGVDAVAQAAGRGPIGLAQVVDVISEAIRHGAGIYNARSYDGCARVYHHAASRILERMPDSPIGPADPPPSGVRLAAEWLAAIVRATPEVTAANGDALAWELRFAFDRIQEISLLDSLHQVLADARTLDGAPDAAAVAEIVRGLLLLNADLFDIYRGAYILRHAARVLVWVAERCEAEGRPARGVLLAARESLRPILDANGRITKSNAGPLAHELATALAGAIETGGPHPEHSGNGRDPHGRSRGIDP